MKNSKKSDDYRDDEIYESNNNQNYYNKEISILEEKKLAFDNAITTYNEFKVNNPNATNKLSDLLPEETLVEWFKLVDDIMTAKYEYTDELSKYKKQYKLQQKEQQNLQEAGSSMDYNNKNLFIFHNTDWSKFSLVAIKEDNRIKLGLSICNDDDNFSRKTGRELAYVRANNGNWSVPMKKTDPIEIRKELYELVQDIIENFDYYKQNYI